MKFEFLVVLLEKWKQLIWYTFTFMLSSLLVVPILFVMLGFLIFRSVPLLFLV